MKSSILLVLRSHGQDSSALSASFQAVRSDLTAQLQAMRGQLDVGTPSLCCICLHLLCCGLSSVADASEHGRGRG
jgi:hypothetical protein